MKMALVQNRVSSNVDQNTRLGLESVRKAASQGAQLVVFPELAFLPFFPQRKIDPRAAGWAQPVPGPTTELFCRLASELGVVIVLNLYEQHGDRTFDSSPVIDSDGSLLGSTRMVHIIEAPCFHEKHYYTPGDRGAVVYSTAVGKLGVAICYDRHYPEYMRSLALKGAEIVVVPQAGAVGEWPAGLFEAELQVAAFQNGYFAALANRVGQEECLNFAGESYVADPSGRVIARAPTGEDFILLAELNLDDLEECAARRHFLPDRRPGEKL